jgi:hypothetical protein
MHRYYRETFPAIKLKYFYPDTGLPNLPYFLAAYEGKFNGEDTEEQMKLLHVAAWMHYMLKGIPATRNKGFYVMMVPKLLEGFDVKYTQGTGQSRFTVNRSDVFHHEAKAKTVKRRSSAS